MAAAFRPDPEATCDACGAAGAFRFEGEALCADCYAVRGATCCSADDSAAETPSCRRAASGREASSGAPS